MLTIDCYVYLDYAFVCNHDYIEYHVDLYNNLIPSFSSV